MDPDVVEESHKKPVLEDENEKEVFEDEIQDDLEREKMKEEEDWLRFCQCITEIRSEIQDYVSNLGIPLCENLSVEAIHQFIDSEL